MGELMGFDDWLQVQNCLIGAALIDPGLVPKIVSELTPEDFTGKGLLVYKAMADLFRRAKTGNEVDAVAVAHYLGDTSDARNLVAQFMSCSPNLSEINRYIAMAKDRAKLSRLRSLGAELSSSVDLDGALGVADSITTQLVDRPGLKGYEPSELLTSFKARHSTAHERIEWMLRVVGDYVRLKKGNLIVLGAEPSGGKTAFALEQMWAFSAKLRVLFVSLETDADTIFDRLISRLTGIKMDALMNGRLDADQLRKVDEAYQYIAERHFKVLPAAGLSISGIKAAAIGYRADVVIIDYLQIIQLPGKKISRYETITEISMGLHILAQSTGLIILALSQVTNRDPQSRGKPLGIHSARESGQIEADADAILMLDKFVEKGLRESGCNANRILRIVKNKNGRCANIPLYFNGGTQTFARALVPDPDWENAQKAKKSSKAEKSSKVEKPQEEEEPLEEFEQLPMDMDVPF